MNRNTTSPLLIYACLGATWIIWGSTYLAIKYALPGFPPYWQMGSRFVVAGALLLAWTRLRGRPWPTLIEWRNAFIVGALMLAGGMGNTALSEQYLPSGLVVVFIAVMPAVIALVSLPFGVRPALLEVLGIAVGFLGVLLLVQGQSFRASPAGLAAICGAVVCWSLGSVLSIHRFRLAPGAVGFASEMLCGSVVLIVISWLVGERPVWPPPALATWSWIYLIVFGSLLAFNAYMVLLARASASLAASYSFVNPLIALLLGIWLGNETVSGQEWLAACIIIAGVVILLIARRRKAAATPVPATADSSA